MKYIAVSSKFILFKLLLLLSAPSQAIVITTGCADATSCSLTELYAGGSISINDVVFDGWELNFQDGGPLDSDSVMISGIDEIASAIPGEATVGLSVVFNPALVLEFIEYDFDFTATIVGSPRIMIGAGLELIDSTISGDGFVEVNNELSNGNLLSVDAGGASSDSSSFAGVTSLISDSDIQMETFDNNPVGLGQYNYGFTIMGEIPSVPEPGTLSLFLMLLLPFLRKKT